MKLPLLLERLRRIHARLDREVAHERGARYPDPGRLTRLKKLRLAIKDRLHAVQRRTVRIG